MSPLIKTRAIVLRHTPHTESSRIIFWITKDHGKMVTLAKGAMRPRSPLSGQFDQLYTCELIYYGRPHDAVLITRDITALATRSRFREDWRAAIAGLYVADLTARVIPAHEPAPELFHLIEEGLDELAVRGWHAPVLFFYELRMLTLLGLAPKLERCASCDSVFSTGHRAVFSSKRGGMICDRCRQSAETHAVGADVLAILNHWRRAPDWNAARNAKCSPPQLSAIRQLMGDFLRYHLDLHSGAREQTLELLLA